MLLDMTTMMITFYKTVLLLYQLIELGLASHSTHKQVILDKFFS